MIVGVFFKKALGAFKLHERPIHAQNAQGDPVIAGIPPAIRTDEQESHQAGFGVISSDDMT